MSDKIDKYLDIIEDATFNLSLIKNRSMRVVDNQNRDEMLDEVTGPATKQISRLHTAISLLKDKFK